MQKAAPSLRGAVRAVGSGKGIVLAAAAGVATFALLQEEHIASAVDSQKVALKAEAIRQTERALARAGELQVTVKEASEALRATQVLLRCFTAAVPSQQFSWPAQAAAAIADLSANAERRQGIVAAANGEVVRWLLSAIRGNHLAVQTEAARALAYLLGDEATRSSVLAHQGALMSLLHFVKSRSCSHAQGHEEIQGRLLLDTIMDMVASPVPSLFDGDAELTDVTAALEVLHASSTFLDGSTQMQTGKGPLVVHDNGPGVQKVIEDAGRSFQKSAGHDREGKHWKASQWQHRKQSDHGLWDDLSGTTVAVLLAAWSLAGWSQASESNQRTIAEVDPEGCAVASGACAPERSVRWHIATAVTALLPGLAKTDRQMADHLGQAYAVPLLAATKSAIGEGWEQQDLGLACHALEALAACAEHSERARNWLRNTGISELREVALSEESELDLQRAVARVLDALLLHGPDLLPEEARRWSGLLMHWSCDKQSLLDMRKVGSQVLDGILRDEGGMGDTLAKAWLAKLLTVLLPRTGEASRSLPTKHEALQEQIVQQAAVAAAQLARVVAEEAAAGGHRQEVKNEAVNKRERDAPVAAKEKGRLKLSSENAVTRALKSLAELVAEDPSRQEHIISAGGLVLLRRILLRAKLESCPPEWSAKRHALRLLKLLSAHQSALAIISSDREWIEWLERCVKGEEEGCTDRKSRSYAQACLQHIGKMHKYAEVPLRYEDGVFLLSTPSTVSDPQLDVVFLHGLCGGPFKTWRVADPADVGEIDEKGGQEGTSWPQDWLAQDFPNARLLSIKYKTNLSEWNGATLPLRDLSVMLLPKLWAAGVGQRPVVFVCHSMGGLVAKQMLLLAQHDPKYRRLVEHTRGMVFFSVPHFGSRLADMPWRMGLVLRPAPSVEDLRSVSPRLDELNRIVKQLHQKGQVAVISFSESMRSPVVRTYGGLALKMEIVPLESAYPGYGDIVLLEDSDHVNACKPRTPSDVIYSRTLQFLQTVQRALPNESRRQPEPEPEAGSVGIGPSK